MAIISDASSSSLMRGFGLPLIVNTKSKRISPNDIVTVLATRALPSFQVIDISFFSFMVNPFRESLVMGISELTRFGLAARLNINAP